MVNWGHHATHSSTHHRVQIYSHGSIRAVHGGGKPQPCLSADVPV